MRANAGVAWKHAARRLAKRDGDDALALGHAFAGTQKKRHAGPTPIINGAFEADKRLGVGGRIDAFFVAITSILAAHDIARQQRQQAAKDFVFFFADRPRLKRSRRLHRHKGENLKEMRHHHIAIGAGALVKADAIAKTESFRHVDLHMVDEISIPDRLEQAIGKAKRQDILRRLLTKKMIDAENLILGKGLVQFGVEFDGAGEVRAERLFHNDARALDELGIGKQSHDRERGLGRHAEIMQEVGVSPEFLGGLGDGGFEPRCALRKRHVIQRRRKCRPLGFANGFARVRVKRFAHQAGESRRVDGVERDADDAPGRDEAGGGQMKQAGQQLALR